MIDIRTLELVKRIELVWPKKGWTPQRRDTGEWELLEPSPVRQGHPLHLIRRVEGGGEGECLLIEGDRLRVLDTLRKTINHQVRFAYLDLPRVEVDDQTRAFQGEGDRPWSTWLCVIREHVRRVLPLLASDAVVALHCGDLEEPYARLLLIEALGQRNHVATIVWQRHYAPRNMPGMKEFTATHDPILVFALDKEGQLPPVGLRRALEGYSNRDGDPRGDWKAEHKGAHTRRESSDFETNIPPYRWELKSGALPPGIWRVSPLAGVIWGTPTKPGDYRFCVAVTDSQGARVEKTFTLTVVEQGAFQLPAEVPWLLVPRGTANTLPDPGKLSILTKSLPQAVIGQEYSAVLLATGGSPHQGTKRPRSGRYWEFADRTLVKAVLQDAVHFGRDGTAIPHPKKYGRPPGSSQAEEAVSLVNQQTWWPARPNRGTKWTCGCRRPQSIYADGDIEVSCPRCGELLTQAEDEEGAPLGYTEDATKHLKKLHEAGLLSETVTTGKPEWLLHRLLEIFTRSGDTVLEVFGEAADLSSVAIKMGRQPVYLAGSTVQERRLFTNCALPRMTAVVRGQDTRLEEAPSQIKMRKDAYIPYEGGGNLTHLAIGEPLWESRPQDEFPYLKDSWITAEFDSLRQAVLTSEGFLPARSDDSFQGRSFDGRVGCLILPPEKFLTQEGASEIVSRGRSAFQRLVVYYFRASDDFAPDKSPDWIAYKRVPMELMA